MHVGGANQCAFQVIGEIAFGAGDEGDVRGAQLSTDLEVGVAQVEDEQRARLEKGEDFGPKPLSWAWASSSCPLA
jgi:hypothetical protein